MDGLSTFGRRAPKTGSWLLCELAPRALPHIMHTVMVLAREPERPRICAQNISFMHSCFTLVVVFQATRLQDDAFLSTPTSAQTLHRVSGYLAANLVVSSFLLHLPKLIQLPCKRSNPFSIKDASSLWDFDLDCSLHVAALNPPAFPMQADCVRCGVGSEGSLYAILSRIWKPSSKLNAVDFLVLTAIDWMSTQNTVVDLNDVTDVQNIHYIFIQQPSSKRSVFEAI